MNWKAALGRAATLAWFLALLSIGGLSALVFSDELNFDSSFDLPGRIAGITAGIVLLAAALSVNWKSLTDQGVAFTACRLLLLAAGGFALHFAISSELGSVVEAQARARAAYAGASDDEILNDLTNHDRFYQPHTLMMNVRRETSENEAILYIGDLRPDPVSYLLYPRPVYVLPQLQADLNQQVFRNWSGLHDPGHIGDLIGGHSAPPEGLKSIVDRTGLRWIVEFHSSNRHVNVFWKVREQK
jgi:hypothetical protein